MPASRLRTRYRQCTGGNRKSCVIRWIGQWTVRVQISRVNDRGVAYVKADNGAEKSCPGRGRRKRGLRNGKRRSRGGKPRRSVKIAAPRSKNREVRAGIHRERMFTAARRSQNALLSSMERMRDIRNFHLFDEARTRQPRTKTWESLKTRWSRGRAPFPRDVGRSIFGKTFLEFMITIDPRQEEVRPPPLPGRPRPPLPAQTYQPAWHVSAVVDHTQGESDRLGPNPCAWCRDSWIAYNELGQPWARCMRIQQCVRRSALIERVNQYTGRRERSHQGNARRAPRRGNRHPR